MNRIGVVLVFVLILVVSTVFGATGNYGYRLYTTPKTAGQIAPAYQDLLNGLSYATGQPFVAATRDSTTGIRLLLLSPDSALTCGLRLPANEPEAALLQSDGDKYLTITAFTRHGLMNGIYTYLDWLGFRWYYPGELWGYKPRLKSIGVKLDTVVQPDMELRTFFGTYGTPRNAVIDKHKWVEGEWNKWAVRNRAGGSVTLKGHAWNAFLWRNYQTLKEHPEYMAMNGGKRAAVTTASKFCISDTGFRTLFINDMLQQLQQQIKANPQAMNYIIPVEPSDGGGDCTCDKCRAMGSVSNRVFLLANETARAFAAISPNAYVNLYAYNTHAQPPAFALEKNVLVQVIPYKYQSYAKPDTLLAQWHSKTPNLYIYDYYGLPLTNIDKPLQGSETYENYLQRLRSWDAWGIKGVTLESSYSIGATGLGLYAMLQYGWNHATNLSELKDAFFDNCYGKAARPMRALQQVLEYETDNASQRLSHARQQLNEADKLSRKDSTIHARIVCWMAYVHYLQLVENLEGKQGKEAVDACDALLTFVYGTFYRMMIHNYPVNEYLKNYGNAKNFVAANWDSMKPSAQGMKYSTVKQLTDKEIEDLFAADCRQ